jgi:hypothetical protein
VRGTRVGSECEVFVRVSERPGPPLFKAHRLTSHTDPSEGDLIDTPTRSDEAAEAVKLREAARAEWSLYYEHMAELHTWLAEEHRQKAQRLLEGAP